MSTEEERVILTPELKARIERNKREALERLQKKLSQRARVHGDRIRRVNGEDAKNNVANGQYVLYWMQSFSVLVLFLWFVRPMMITP